MGGDGKTYSQVAARGKVSIFCLSKCGNLTLDITQAQRSDVSVQGAEKEDQQDMHELHLVK